VFASANTSNMDQLVDANEVEGEPEIFATNVVEIAVAAGNPAGVDGLDDFGLGPEGSPVCGASVDETMPCGHGIAFSRWRESAPPACPRASRAGQAPIMRSTSDGHTFGGGVGPTEVSRWVFPYGGWGWLPCCWWGWRAAGST